MNSRCEKCGSANIKSSWDKKFPVDKFDTVCTDCNHMQTRYSIQPKEDDEANEYFTIRPSCFGTKFESKETIKMDLNSSLKSIKNIMIAQLQELQKSEDTENAHIRADEKLCQFLTLIGHDDLVQEFEKIIR